MRRLARLLLISIVTGCGGGGDSGTPTSPPPNNNTPPAVASVTVSPSTNSILAGATVQLTATLRDAQGNTLTGRSIAWSTSAAAQATVNSAGLVTTVTAGEATITATSEGKSGDARLTIVNPREIPFFDKPFAGEFPTANFLDHDVPKEFVDNNSVFTTFWGEVHTKAGFMTDGHSGYDFMMPTGTPLLAVAAGTVKRVQTTNTPFFCPPLNKDVSDQQGVWIEHDLPGGVKVQSWYVHLSRIDVTVGQAVTAGQAIGLSGNTGCSTGPHLHFEVFRVGASASLTTIDPYGWSGDGTDPWEAKPDGSASIRLWKSGQAPALWREANYGMLAFAPFAPLVLTKIVYEGVDDAKNPNNEYVELTLDTRLASTLSLNGYGVRPQDSNSLAYVFPNGLTLTAAQPTVRVYTGSGTNSGLTLYMGRTAGVWANYTPQLCARVTYPNGTQSARYFACQ